MFAESRTKPSAQTTLANSRAKLAAQQTALMAALTTQKSIAGFDAERMQITALSLQQKRLRTVEHAHPCLASALGLSFTELFNEYSEVYPIPAASETTDALQFMDYLAKCDLLPDHLWRGYFLNLGWKHQRNWWYLLRRCIHPTSQVIRKNRI
ncbi:MAG: hypothetical protein HYX67_05095 [Candidatus Melainabacteria bacterium]|nr:hypothetical protein [Candidatus Melainabacteria bacterium]